VVRFLDDYYKQFEGRAEKALTGPVDQHVSQSLQDNQPPPVAFNRYCTKEYRRVLVNSCIRFIFVEIFYY
jgi:hypothetical protein